MDDAASPLPTLDEAQPVARTSAFVHRGTVLPVPLMPLPLRPEYRVAFGLSRRARRTLDAFRPDLIHIAVPDLLGYQALRFGQKRKLPTVASYHTRYETYLKHYYGMQLLHGTLCRYLRFFYNSCLEIYAPSSSMMETLKAPSDAGPDQFAPRRRIGLPTSRFCLACQRAPEAKPVVTLQARNFAQPLALNEILPFRPRGNPNIGADAKSASAAAEEWTLFELLGVSGAPSAVGRDEVSALGGRASRSLLCLIAPLLALLALARTTRATQAFAFPVACLFLMCIDLGGNALAKAFAPLGPGPMLGILCLTPHASPHFYTTKKTWVRARCWMINSTNLSISGRNRSSGIFGIKS